MTITYTDERVRGEELAHTLAIAAAEEPRFISVTQCEPIVTTKPVYDVVIVGCSIRGITRLQKAHADAEAERDAAARAAFLAGAMGAETAASAS